MSSMRVMNPRVRWFTEEMRKKLRLNTHKPDSRREELLSLFDRLQQETGELRSAVLGGNIDNVIEECADVANFAMMIADKVQHKQS